MDDLVAFARRTDLPALAQIAIAHAQFETVHPFPDGNGRTGRALVQAMLRRLGVTRNVTVPVSAGLLRDTRGYFDALTDYRAGNIEPIVRAFAQASADAIVNGRQLVADLTAIRADWENITSARVGSAGRRLLEVLQRQPVIDANLAGDELGIDARNAQNGIDRLVADGILDQSGTGARNRTYEAREVLGALDAFAARAKRRR
jgi:Fic family protein